MRAQAIVASAMLLLCPVAQGEEPESAPQPLRVAVPDMRGSGVDEDLASTLTDVITVEANRIDGVTAIGVADIEAMLGFEQKKQLVGCDDVTCMAEIGGALGVNAIVSSKLGKIGDTFILTVRVIDTAEVTVIGSTQETVEGKPDALVAASRRAVNAVLTPLARGTDAVAGAQTERDIEPSGGAAAGGANEPGGDINWAAWALVGAGAVAAVAGAAAVGAAAAIFSSQQDQTVQRGELTYWPVGSGAQLGNAQLLGTSGTVAIGVGLALAAGGGVWLVLGGAQDQEVRP